MGTVNGELFKVRSAVAVELCIEVGEESALEERVLGEVDAADDVAGLELYNVRDGIRWSAVVGPTMTCSVSAK